MTKYLEILFRYWPRFVAICLLIPFGISAVLVYLMPVHTATARLWVDTPTLLQVPGTTSVWNQYTPPAQNTIDILQQLAKTDQFSHDLAHHLEANGTWAPGSPDEKATIGGLATDLSMKAGDSHLITLTMTCKRAVICVAVLSATIDVYHAWVIQTQGEQSKGAIDYYSAQLTKAQTDLKNDQEALAKYIAGHPDVKPGAQTYTTEFDTLVRAVDHDRTIVNDLQSKVDGANTATRLQAPANDAFLKVIDVPQSAGGGLISSLPKKQIGIAWGACVGLGLVYLFLLGWVDRTARDEKEIEHRLGVPVVATIPVLGKSERLS